MRIGAFLAGFVRLFRPAPARALVVGGTATNLPVARCDPSPAQLGELQGLCRQWLVMWCWYRREYMAIARFDTRDPILFAVTPQQLVYACRAAELAVV
ncbi:hypothetical protein GCM10010151_40700 [Actinoallomurus spadix]|uniref:Uncharacterized protein n=1 Tax=Actinoallomurus spadix TaxID=79912 RepID=A0ABN0WUI2_9ACTN